MVLKHFFFLILGSTFITGGPSVYIVNKVTHATTGSYKCTGLNSHGNTSIEFVLSMKMAPKILQAERTPIANGLVHLTCLVEGMPLPEVVIESDNTQYVSTYQLGSDILLNSTIFIDSNGEKTKEIDTTRFLRSRFEHFSKLLRTKEDTLKVEVSSKKISSLFKCSATNIHGTDEAEVLADVKELRFHRGGSKMSVDVGINESLNLSCLLDKDLNATVRWFEVSSFHDSQSRSLCKTWLVAG